VYRLDLFPDYSAFPVWQPQMAGPGPLGISAGLADDLRDWQAWWERHSRWGGGESATVEQRQAWTADGKALARRLADETGAAVVYRWPFGSDGADPECPHCGHLARRMLRP